MNSRIVLAPHKTAKILFYQNKKNNWSLLKLRQISQSNFTQQQAPEGAAPKPNNVNPPKSGSIGLKVFAFALTGFTIGLGYAYVDQNTRRQISNKIPQANVLFDKIDSALGKSNNTKLEEKKPKVDVALNKKSNEEIPPAPAPIIENEQIEKKPEPAKNTETVKVAPTKAKSKKADAKKPEEVAPVVEKKEPEVDAKKTQVVEEPAKDLDWKAAIKNLELKEEAIIDEFEKKLNGLEKGIKHSVSETVDATREAVETLNNYKQALRDALDEKFNSLDKETQWKNVTEFFEKQSQKVAEAKQKFTIGNKAIEELEVMINEAKKNELFKNLNSLRQSLKDLIEQQRTVKQEESKLKEALIHANVLRTYTNEQKAARSQFLKEIQALQPEGIQGKRISEDQLSTEEINNLLIHAHKRVVQLQNQLEKMQMSQNQQIQAALEDQRKQYASLQEQNNDSLRQLNRQEFELEKDKIFEAEKAKTTEAINKELATQAAAHNNHLAQMLKMQQEELAAFYERKLTSDRERIRGEFFEKVAETLGKINGIENALKARVNLELQANNASQLWLAVQNLNQIISSSMAEADSELAKIKTNIETITASAPENEFVQKLVNSVPKKALDDGVWTEPDLKERFQRVKNVCSKVALIDERGGSLFKYFLSYVQSFFIMNTKIDSTNLENGLPKLDDFDMSTFNILKHAEYYLENGQTDLAVKLMRQLKGEPSRLARDWINDTTVLLEIKQATQLLTSYISSIYIGTHLK